MKKFIMFLNIFFIFIAILSFVNVVMATDVIGAMQGITEGADSSSTGKLGPIINTVIGFIQVVGTGISVIMVTVLGIKYILSAPGEKADVKKQIAPLIIGAVVLFASVNIVDIAAKYAESLPTGN